MVIVVGHRGSAGDAPENTLLGFRKCAEAGCGWTEFDVRLTRDGVPIVIHDETVDRTTDGTGRVDAMALEEIRELSCGEGQRVPTLDEVLAFCRDRMRMHVELKADGTPAPVCERIREHGVEKEVVITSFEKSLLDEVRAITHEVALGFLFKEMPRELWADAAGYEYVCPKHTIVTAEFVREAHASGKKVYAYHVDDEETFRRMIECGVDAVGTDFPGEFR